MKDKRPIHLNLLTIRQPISAITSILHRISGVFVYLMIPGLLWALQSSLSSDANFQQFKSHLSSFGFKTVVILTLWALLYHLLAGIKHLMMDLGFWEGRVTGPIASQVLLVIFALTAVTTGILLW